MGKTFVFLALLGLSLAAIKPLENFEVGLLAQGSGGLYIDWYLQSIYDPTGRNWNEVACATTAFMYGHSFGVMVNFSSALTSTNGGVQMEEPIYYDMNNQSVFYSDEAKTQLRFFVANYSFTFVEGEEVDLIILAVPAPNNEYILMAYAPIFAVGKWHFDITDYLQSNGLSPVENVNYFHPEDWCFYMAPSTAYLTFTNPDKILGEWYVTAVTDTRKHFNWRGSTCSTLNFGKNSSSNLYLMNTTVDGQTHGPYEFINDPANVTLFVGYYFSDWATATDLILEVFYADAFGNIGVTSQDTCFGAIINQNNKPISNAIFTAFQVYFNTYAAKFCYGYQKQDPIKLTNTGCSSNSQGFWEIFN